MFWLSAIPTPGRQCRQRLPTLILDDVMAAPSWLVVSSQAAIDNVISFSFLGAERLRTVGSDVKRF